MEFTVNVIHKLDPETLSTLKALLDINDSAASLTKDLEKVYLGKETEPTGETLPMGLGKGETPAAEQPEKTTRRRRTKEEIEKDKQTPKQVTQADIAASLKPDDEVVNHDTDDEDEDDGVDLLAPLEEKKAMSYDQLLSLIAPKIQADKKKVQPAIKKVMSEVYGVDHMSKVPEDKREEFYKLIEAI